jgi:hypothetical protein
MKTLLLNNIQTSTDYEDLKILFSNLVKLNCQ